MTKITAFQKYFSEPVLYGYPWGYLLDAEHYTADEAREIFYKEFSNNITDENYNHNRIKHDIASKMQLDYVCWHAGISEDGEPGNGWWIGEPIKNRSKRVFTLNPDMHMYRTGHSFHQVHDIWGKPIHRSECANCGERK